MGHWTLSTVVTIQTVSLLQSTVAVGAFVNLFLRPMPNRAKTILPGGDNESLDSVYRSYLKMLNA